MVAKQLFVLDVNFSKRSSKFTQIYYDLILVDTQSVAFHHHKDKKTETFITNTLVQIHIVA